MPLVSWQYRTITRLRQTSSVQIEGPSVRANLSMGNGCCHRKVEYGQMKKKLNIPAIQWVKRYQVPIIIESALVTACHKQGDTTAAAKIPTPVKIRQVQPLAGATHARYSGSIEPQTRVDLAFKVGGYVQYVAVTKEPMAILASCKRGTSSKRGLSSRWCARPITNRNSAQRRLP